jgi:putative addiction module killer protein
MNMRVIQTDRYSEWLESLKDRASKAHLVRVERLIHGNPGKHRNLANGITELKIDFGPGFRVYYSIRGNELLLLLAGGDKSSQQNDIEIATELLAHFKET